MMMRRVCYSATLAWTLSIAPAQGASAPVKGEQVAVMPEVNLAVCWQPHTFVPVTIHVRPPGKAIFRDGAIRSVVVYENFSTVNMEGEPNPDRVAIEVQALQPPHHPFGPAFEARNVLAREKLAPEALRSETGLTEPETRQLSGLTRWRVTPKDKTAPFFVHTFNTDRFRYLFSRRAAAARPFGIRLQFLSMRPIAPTIDLRDTRYGIYFW